MKNKMKIERTRSARFSAESVELSRIFAGLAHPARISILQTLADRGECVCGEIVNVVPLAQSTVSQHLKQLSIVELIQGEIEGAKSCYCINYKKLAEFSVQLEKLLKKLASSERRNRSGTCQR